MYVIADLHGGHVQKCTGGKFITCTVFTYRDEYMSVFSCTYILCTLKFKYVQ